LVASAEGPFRRDVGDSVRLVDFNSPRVVRCLPRLIAYLRRERPQILFSALDHANLTAIWASRLANCGTQTLISVHSLLLQGERPSLRQRIVHRATRFFYPMADTIVTVSEDAARQLAAVAKLPIERIRVVHNPVLTPELSGMKGREPDHPWLAAKSVPVVLAVGRLVESKNFASLIEAFARVRAKRLCRLVIIGEGPRRQELHALASRLGVHDDVSLPGFMANPYACMANADVFVMCSRWESFGNVLVEAMFCGCPVIGANCPGGTREILGDGRFGELIEVDNLSALADAIQHVLDHPEPRSDARARANDFTVEAVCRAYARLFQG
jgi:glycosyltransferase involved in cell wall biosynthesis